MITHSCLWTSCENLILGDKMLCRHHWFKLPDDLRHEVTASYRGGTISNARTVAIKKVKQFIADYDKEPT